MKKRFKLVLEYDGSYFWGWEGNNKSVRYHLTKTINKSLNTSLYFEKKEI